jgi:hypothetical protein
MKIFEIQSPTLVPKTRRTLSPRLRRIALALTLFSLTVSCAPEVRKKSYEKECVLPEDQSKTLAAQWKIAPVPLAFKSGQFSPAEMAEIVAAAAVWNSFFEAVRGYKIFDYGDASAPHISTAAKPAVACSEPIISGNSFSGQVIIYKDAKWPYSNKDAIAITNLCKSQTKTFPRLYGAHIEINYENFFVAGKKSPDLKSIFIHEFGHLIGLDHSCSTKTLAGFPNCNDANMDQNYFEAVMFPVILFDSTGRGEQRHSLNRNDQGRANCLYEAVDGG